MNKYILLFFFIPFTVGIFAQMPVSELERKTHCRQLKEGVLLVQLPNSDKKIEKLLAMGKVNLARIEEEEVNIIREDIISGFKKDWNFSEILFFESKHSKEVFNKDYTFMLDRDLKPLKELPEFEHFYSVRYGPGNPNGEVYRYNGNGFQIRYVKDGRLQTIKYDVFFNADKLNLRLRHLFKKKGRARRNHKIYNLNYDISNVIF